MLVALFGGGLSMAILAYRRHIPDFWVPNQAWALRLHHPKTGIPYGIALAAAGLSIYPSTWAFAVLAQGG
jgi:prepilin peptidase CpaA